MKEWVEIIVGICAIASLAGSGVMAWLWAVKYRIPNFESRLQALEGVHDDGVRTLVHKHEIYTVDGRPIYMHRTDCERDRLSCLGNRTTETEDLSAQLVALRRQLENMEKNRNRARTEMVAFMTAVKEKLDLRYVVPES
jgi:hypothetical protein